MSSNTSTALLGTEKVSTLLKRYAIPSIIAMTASSLYNIIDSVFIGHGVGPLALSALAIALPLMNLAAAFGAMVGIGASSLLSIKLGQDDKPSAMAILGNAVLLNVIIGLVFGLVCLTFLDPILYSFGASDDTIVYARDFMRILLIGNVFTHVYLGLNSILRAAGHPSKSMTIMLVAVAANAVLAAVFVLWFKWGIAGAAWGTVIAQFLAMVLEIVHFTDKRRVMHFTRSIFKPKRNIIKGILSIGIAPFLMNVTASVVVIFINNALKTYGGDIHIGAYGIVNRVTLIFLMIVFGLNQGMQPIVGYNYGAMKYDRVRKVLRMGIIVGMSVTTFGFLLGMFFPRLISLAFTTNETLLSVSEQGLRIVMLAYPLVGFQIVASSFFQSIGKAYKAIILSLTRQLLFLLPLLIMLPKFLDIKGVWLSMPIADTLSVVVTAAMLAYQIRQFKKSDIRILSDGQQ